MSNLLSRDQILNASDIHTEDVEVPEWGGTVRVRGLSGAERDQFESAMMSLPTRGKGKSPRRTKVTTDNFRARLAAASIVDEEGRRMFSDSDVRTLGEKSAAALDRVMDVAMRLSALTEEDAEELEGE